MKDAETSQPVVPIYVVSGGKGIAGHTMVHSLIIQYPENKIPVHVIPEVQGEVKINEVVRRVKRAGGILCHTMVNTELRALLKKACRDEGVKEIDFMGELSDFLEKDLGLKSVNVPGLYRRINAQYFDRIEAIEYTLNHDDGANTARIKEADIVLTGVSRSGKTPLSVYMSMFGWKVANVPLIKGINPPEELFTIDPNRVFGLSIGSSHLIVQRAKRMAQLGITNDTVYIDDKMVKEELRYAQFIFRRGGFFVVNVTNKPIETTANEIIGIISDRFGHQDRKLKNPDADLA
ncbi:MAG: kinase/pyrophosphorylase [Bacteroidales bacterium]|nr:kinase/pyrophosphorylase [Bacteroidales bacterium]